jgi:hypothetical protein
MSEDCVNEFIKQRGEVEVVIDHKDGKQERFVVKNAILFSAKYAHANALCNNIGQTYQYYIQNMIFGTNGTFNGAPRVVDSGRNGLFGPTLVSKNVMSTVNPQMPNQAIFTAVIGFDEGNGNIISEMALMMKTGDLYSMVTLGGISKDSTIQITFNWRLTFV